MAMNLECMLLLQKLGLLSSGEIRFLDIGPQNVYFCTADQIKKLLAGRGIADDNADLLPEIERLVYHSTPRPDERTTLFSEIADLANIEYNSFDVCPAIKTELLDLNFDVLPDKHRSYYDIAINFGTTEHILNQWNCFSVIHDAVRPGGVMYHVLPATGYLDHGYYCYTPLFFEDLAKANGYEIVEMFMALAGVSEIGLDIRSDSQFDKPGSGQTPSAQRGIPSYNLHVILRKQQDGPFRAALEVATAHAAVDERMSARYADAPAPGQRPAAQDQLSALVEQLTGERDHLQRESIARMQERDEKSAEIIAQDARIQELLRACEDKDNEIAAREAELQALSRST